MSVRGSLDLLAVHPTFWGELPTEYTKKANVAGALRSGGTIKIQVPGYQEFYIKPVEYGDTRNGNYLLCGVLANTRQNIGVAGTYLVEPDEIEAGKLHMLRNTDRYPIRKFIVHYGEKLLVPEPKKRTLRSILSKEIPALAILDKKIF